MDTSQVEPSGCVADDALRDFLDHADALKTFGLWDAFRRKHWQLLEELMEVAA
jgi:hypothetical protein